MLHQVPIRPTQSNQTISFVIPSGVSVYGGYTGTGFVLPGPKSGTSTLSGEIGTGSTADNTNSIVYFSNSSSNTLLDDFTISGANGAYGGGIYIIVSGSATAVCEPTIQNCIIENNVVSNSGGGVYAESISFSFRGMQANPRIISCIIRNNSADTGGAIYTSGNNGALTTANPNAVNLTIWNQRG